MLFRATISGINLRAALKKYWRSEERKEEKEKNKIENVYYSVTECI
jgi:hypothetical protein